MAVKVIKEGKIPEEIPRKIICWHCDSELEYKNEDFQFDSKDKAYIKCPVCKFTISNITFGTYVRNKTN